MNLSSLKPQQKFQPIFTKKLKDPNQILKDGVINKINFDVNDEKRRGKINKKISSSKITAAALNLFVHKVEQKTKEKERGSNPNSDSDSENEHSVSRSQNNAESSMARRQQLEKVSYKRFLLMIK